MQQLVPPPLPSHEDQPELRRLWIGGAIVGILLVVLLIAAMVQSGPTRDELGADGDTAGAGTESGNRPGAPSQGDRDELHASSEEEGSHKEELGSDERRSEKSSPGATEGDSISDVAPPRSTLPEVGSQPTTQSTTPTANSVETRQTRREFFTLWPERGAAHVDASNRATEGNEEKIQHALSGRKSDAKESLVREGGGTDVTEGAVKLGLEWLARHQRSDGLWSLEGPYEDGGSHENVAVATAMALIAFQGAGHTHRGDPLDPYTQVVARGSVALVDHIEENGRSYRSGFQHGGYTQAICTIALCELYGMTRDARLKNPTRDAVQYCIDAQSSEGGWRYAPGQDSDTSVTGWFVMALQSARMAGLKIPMQTFMNVSKYLDAAGRSHASRYSYQPGGAATPSMTAEALLCRQYLGWERDDPQLLDGSSYLLENLPERQNPNVYYWYYATQVCHHMQGKQWQRWNDATRVLLPQLQEKGGSEAGSWNPEYDPHGRAGGRLYVTCFCIYMLEVYYRHLPIYHEIAIGSEK